MRLSPEAKAALAAYHAAITLHRSAKAQCHVARAAYTNRTPGDDAVALANAWHAAQAKFARTYTAMRNAMVRYREARK